ncbi:hypothetical protein SAMN05421579_11456 [Xenorhabdus japonica]|uniref:Uncharacterized protein n=1 Tax=Xenorhabdus japonica TaxID=53341 RepID=A0A1I5AWR2_9GAMM|nr:hypothetical protein SAMN05421579_11456 [Xenorhabdus japonica]
MYNKFTNKHEKDMTTNPYTQNQLIKSCHVIIAGEINGQPTEK